MSVAFTTARAYPRAVSLSTAAPKLADSLNRRTAHLRKAWLHSEEWNAGVWFRLRPGGLDAPVPRELPFALSRKGEQWAAFVEADRRARLRIVKAGRSSGTETQVLEGLKQGEEVIQYPGSRVRDGQCVTPVVLEFQGRCVSATLPHRNRRNCRA
jgi:hypothetical protein